MNYLFKLRSHISLRLIRYNGYPMIQKSKTIRAQEVGDHVIVLIFSFEKVEPAPNSLASEYTAIEHIITTIMGPKKPNIALKNKAGNRRISNILLRY